MYSVTGSWLPGFPGGAARLVAVGAMAVDAAEHQAALDRVQLGQAPALLGRGEIALDPGLERTACTAAAKGLGQRLRGPLAGAVQQAVEHIDVRLFLADRIRGRNDDGIGLARRHIS